MTRASFVRLTVFLGIAALGLAACGTMEGMGHDLSSAGKAIEKSAGDTQKKM